MVTAPLLTVGIPVDLPKVKSTALTDQKDPIEITIKTDGKIYLGDSEAKIENIVFMLEAITEQNQDARIYIRADRIISYGRVMEVMSTINTAGYKKVALVTQNPEKN
tara:strand:- start:228 stop:548 length:321 start_codon:yes stop_codon:yes gene_type:complete